MKDRRYRPLDIAIINNDYPPFIFGGIGSFAHELAKGLVRKGFGVNVITGCPETIFSIGRIKPWERIENGINVLRFPYPDYPPRHTVFQFWNYKKLLNTIQGLDVDVIHGQCGSVYPILENLKRNAPVLVTFHSSPLMDKIASAQSIFRGGTFKDFFTYFIGYPEFSFVYRKELQLCDTAVTVSKSLKSEIVQEMGEKNAQKIRSIQNGVDIESLDQEYEEAGKDISESVNIILFAGRLYWRKGALNIVRLAYFLQKRKTHFKIIVHGSGPLYNKMRELINSLRLKNIDLKGFTTKKQLMKSMRLCKFVAIPSFYEACPMSLLEGMCLGKIPLMLNLPFSSELTEGGKYGLLGNGMNDLTNKLITMKNTNSLSRISTNIQEFARHAYDIDRVTNEYIKIYRELLV